MTDAFEPERYQHRAIKAAQGWRCADCGLAHGGRDAQGHIVQLAVVRVGGGVGRLVALCVECRRERQRT